MPTTQNMNTIDAANSIGKYIVALSPDTWAKKGNGDPNTTYPAPSIFTPAAGAPSMTVRWDSARDDDDGLDMVSVPPSLLFETRIYHPSYPSSTGGYTDWFQEAQQVTLLGASVLLDEFNKDETLGDRIIRVTVPSIVSGPLLDANNVEYYGVQLTVNCQIH